MPQKNITETGPQGYKDLQEQNATQFLDKKTRKAWLKHLNTTANGINFLAGKNSNIMDDGTFADKRIEQMFQDAYFYDSFKTLPNINQLTNLTRGQRIAFYNKYKGSADIYRARELDKGSTGISGYYDQYTQIPFSNEINQFGIPTQQQYNEMTERKVAAEETVYGLNDEEAIKNNEEFHALYDKLWKEANDVFLPPEWESMGMITMGSPTAGRMASMKLYEADKQATEQAKYEYVRDRLKLPEKENPFTEVTPKQFTESLDKLSAVYNKLNGSKWLNLSEYDIMTLYNKYKDDLKVGKIWKVEAGLDKDLGNIVEKNQPGWFQSGGDELVHSRSKVFFEQAAAGAVENLMDALLVPAGLIYGGAKAIVTGNNFWEESSFLPSIAHDVAHNITGDNSTAYGDSLSSALANSGYTIGTMAIDAALMAAPTSIAKAGGLFKATNIFNDAAKAAKFARFNKIYGTAMSVNFGLSEGTVDALDIRDQIIENAKKQSQSLPPSQREAFMNNAIYEANSAYGRTLLEESLVVNTGTLLGLGFLGSISPTRLINFSAPKWQRMIPSLSKAGKIGSFVGHTVEGVAKTSLGELLEEYAQGMSSGINKARAEYNIENYAEGLHYGLGSEYLDQAHLGFMQGLERFAPRAWVEMDPENLTKQVLMSTLLFRGLKVPGFGGKSRAQIKVDNNTAIGKLWDNIRKYSPLQTGIGQIIADAKADTFDIENSLQRGFTELINNPDIIDVMQDQAALTDIGIQMMSALDKKDISQYSKTAAAYQVAQGIMLANAARHNTKFGRDYVEILNKRANFKNFSQEEQQEVLKNYLDELQINAIKKVSQEEQIDIMVNTAKQSLDIMNQASEIMDRLSKDPNLEGNDMRPLVFAELLYKNTPQAIQENWESVKNAVNQSDILNITDDQLNTDNINPEIFHNLLNGYFNQDGQEYRDNIFGTLISKGFKRDDITKTLNYIENVLEKTDPWVKTYVKNDLDLTLWRKNIASQWSKMYQRVRDGETVFDEEGFLDRIQNKIDSFMNSPKKQRKRFLKDINNARGLSDIYNAYNEVKNDSNTPFDVEEALNSITDSNRKKQIDEVKSIMRAQNSIKVNIIESEFGDTLQEDLHNQVDVIASRAESINDLFDISKYDFTGVREDLVDEMSYKLTKALEKAGRMYGIAQTIDPSKVKPQSQTDKANKKSDLGNRDINTTPATNDTPITKYTKDEADNIINEINDLMNSDSYDGDIVADKIDDLSRRYPDGYKIVRGGTQVAMIKVVQETVVNEVDDEELDTNIDFIPEEYVIDSNEVIPVDESINTYPDNDVRSVTMVAIGKFDPDGHYYAFPIRDEQVDNTTRARASYVDDKGITHTNISGPLEIITVNDYNKRTESDPKEFKSLEEIVKNYPRPTFVNQDNNEVIRTEQSKAFTTNRTEAQQQRLNNNITNSRNEISYEDQHSSKERLADVAHRSIDAQLDEQGAFEYRNSGALQIGDKISFVCSVETMPDGKNEVVIWEVTKPKDKQIPSDGKFKGMQVLDVLDQTNMSGDRKELIERIRKAYDDAGRPNSFLYNKEEFEVTNIIDGMIPFKETNPVDAISDSVIENNNLKNSLSKSNGKYGIKFFNPKTGKFTIVPAILRQTERRANNTTVNKPTRKINEVEVLKKERATQNPTKEVMLVIPTPTGYKAVHSVYVMKRGIEGAVEKYKQAINEGSIGRVLIDRIKQKMIPSNFKNPTSFSDFFTFGRYVNEHIKYFDTHDQLELGYTRGDLTVLIYAHKIGDNKWVETGRNVSEVINDNNGQGFTLDDICKMYLERLIDDPVADASLRINIDAMAKDVKSGQEILNALIDDGMLWTPNSIGPRIGIENVGFSAAISKKAPVEEKPKEIKKETASTPVTAPVEKPLKPESVKPPVPKEDVKINKTNVGSHIGVPRAKKKASDTKKDNVTPNRTQEQTTPTTNVINDFNNLTKDQQQSISEKGITEEQFNNLTNEEKNNLLNCIQ